MKEYRLLEKVYQNALEGPELPALYYRAGGQVESISCYALWFRIKQCGAYYGSCGGERVGILGGNTWQWVCNAFGMIAAGCATAFLDPLAPVKDLTGAAERSGLQVLVYDEDERETAEEIGARLSGVRLLPYCHLLDIPKGNRPAVTDFEGQEGDILFFTSGTSKRAKIAVMPAEAMEGTMATLAPLVCHAAGETAILPIPFHHAYGFVMLNMYCLARCPVFISSARRIARDIPAARPSFVAAVPHMLDYLCSRGLLDPAYVSSVVTAGSRFSPELAERVQALGIVPQNLYGSSELPGIGISCPGDAVDAITLNQSVQAQISPAGEVLLRSPFHLSEYYGSPEDTAAALDGDTFYTGDAGYLDEQGRLHLLGRKRDTIVMDNGEKVFCPDVDEAVRSFPGVRDGAVIYVKKKLVAVMELEQGADLRQVRSGLDAYNREQPYYRRIAELWAYPGSFPYTSSGKLPRRLLEDAWRAGRA